MRRVSWPNSVTSALRISSVFMVLFPEPLAVLLITMAVVSVGVNASLRVPVWQVLVLLGVLMWVRLL